MRTSLGPLTPLLGASTLQLVRWFGLNLKDFKLHLRVFELVSRRLMRTSLGLELVLTGLELALAGLLGRSSMRR